MAVQVFVPIAVPTQYKSLIGVIPNEKAYHVVVELKVAVLGVEIPAVVNISSTINKVLSAPAPGELTREVVLPGAVKVDIPADATYKLIIYSLSRVVVKVLVAGLSDVPVATVATTSTIPAPL